MVSHRNKNSVQSNTPTIFAESKFSKGDIITIRSKNQSFTTKPRSAIVYQNGVFGWQVEGVTIILLSSTLIDAEPFRITILPNPDNGLKHISQAMTDKITTMHKSDIVGISGKLDVLYLQKIDEALKLWLNID